MDKQYKYGLVVKNIETNHEEVKIFDDKEMADRAFIEKADAFVGGVKQKYSNDFYTIIIKGKEKYEVRLEKLKE